MSISSIENRLIPNALVADDNRLAKEVMVFCPSCLAFETVWFTSGALNRTRKFTQYGKHVYHDCGSSDPCRIYTNL